MKKLFILLTSFVSVVLSAQEDRTLNFGFQWGFHGNPARFSGGMEEANARFQQNNFGGIGLDLIARYDHNKHWMATSGVGLSNYGFEFGLSENYSLPVQRNRNSVIRTDFALLNLPFMIYYKFNPDCRNKKWLAGAGFVASTGAAQTVSKNFETGTEGNSNYKYLSASAISRGGGNLCLRLSIGRERLFKCGGLLQAAFVLNIGFRDLAKATVVYTIDGKEYTHDFVTKGNFIGFRIAYFCRSLQKKLGK